MMLHPMKLLSVLVVLVATVAHAQFCQTLTFGKGQCCQNQIEVRCWSSRAVFDLNQFKPQGAVLLWWDRQCGPHAVDFGITDYPNIPTKRSFRALQTGTDGFNQSQHVCCPNNPYGCPWILLEESGH